MIRDSQGTPLDLFDIVVVENVPRNAVAWTHDELTKENILECKGKYGLITYDTSVATEPQWHTKDGSEINVIVKKFFKGKWHPIEIHIPSHCVKKVDDDLVISILFVELPWIIERPDGPSIFPARSAARYLAVFDAILAMPLQSLEELSRYLDRRLQK